MFFFSFHQKKQIIFSIKKTVKGGFNDDEVGFLYLFDRGIPNYNEDGISWKKSKMSVKQIIQNGNSYKLRNHKNDQGKPIMRRQTWIQQQEEAIEESAQEIERLMQYDDKDPKKRRILDKDYCSSWRKHEYKLIIEEIIYTHNENGEMKKKENSKLREFPVLVHYFKKM